MFVDNCKFMKIWKRSENRGFQRIFGILTWFFHEKSCFFVLIFVVCISEVRTFIGCGKSDKCLSKRVKVTISFVWKLFRTYYYILVTKFLINWKLGNRDIKFPIDCYFSLVVCVKLMNVMWINIIKSPDLSYMVRYFRFGMNYRLRNMIKTYPVLVTLVSVTCTFLIIYSIVRNENSLSLRRSPKLISTVTWNMAAINNNPFGMCPVFALINITTLM